MMQGSGDQYDLLGALQGVRAIADKTVGFRGDPLKAMAEIEPRLSEIDGAVAPLRKLAPGLGEIWDTARSMFRLADLAIEYAALKGAGGDRDRLSDSPAEPAPVDSSGDVGAPGEPEEWDEPEPDD